jgi:PAS domain S-box-containing protein
MILSEACLEQDETFDRLARLVAKAVQSSAAFVTLADRGADEILFAGITGLPEIQAGERKTLSQTICRHVVSSGSSLVVPDTETHPLAMHEPAILELGLGAYLGVPLTTAAGEVIGVLCTVDRHAREWSQAQIEIAEGLAAAVMTEIGLRTAEARYRSLIENIPLVTYMNSVEEPFSSLYMSPQLESLLGYTPEEWAAQPELAIEGIHPDDRVRVRALAAEARELGIPTRSEFRFIARDGRTVWVLDQTIPMRDADGTILYHQGFLLDITEQKQLEEQLRQSQKMDAIGQLAGGIAHDFNNMLTAISGYAELLAISFDEGDPRADDVDQVRKAAAHAAALTR